MPKVKYRHNSKRSKLPLILTFTGLILVLLTVSILAKITLDSRQPIRPSTPTLNLENNIDTADNKLVDPLSPNINPTWPVDIQSAVGAVGYGVLAESDPQAKAVPMASLAKVMAAILVIEKDNVTVKGPIDFITFTNHDEDLYNEYLYLGGVVTAVKTGNKISQLEALKAMLIISSNNLADTTVIDSYGSVANYLVAANTKAEELGLKNTNFDDVTGFSPKTVSTAHDLIVLAEYAIQNPLFAEIVSTWQTTILGNVKLTNTNAFLDFEDNNVIGIKSGLTDEAGGTYIGAARYQTKTGKNITALVVTLGSKSHYGAQTSAIPLLTYVKDAF